MVKILPFKGILYDQKKVSLAKVIAPPYDIISDPTIYHANKYNITHLDIVLNNEYTKAAELFKTWLNSDIITTDRKPAIYVYEQEYSVKGKKHTRKGFIALVKLEDYENGIILPHENTLQEQVKDRLRLLRACKANFNPVFGLYSGSNVIDKILETKHNSIIDVRYENVRHRLWSISDENIIEKVMKEMQKKKVFIADGHHRYEAALCFRDENPAANYVLMYFTNLYDKGLTILPTHRLVNGINLENIMGLFCVKPCHNSEKMFKQMKINEHVFGMYYKNKYYLLTLKSGSSNELDIILLHTLLDRIGVKNITYVTEETQAIKLADEKDSIAIFLNPTKPEQVETFALARKKLPGKATYFWPKLLSGLVMYKL